MAPKRQEETAGVRRRKRPRRQRSRKLICVVPLLRRCSNVSFLLSSDLSLFAAHRKWARKFAKCQFYFLLLLLPPTLNLLLLRCLGYLTTFEQRRRSKTAAAMDEEPPLMTMLQVNKKIGSWSPEFRVRPFSPSLLFVQKVN